MGSLNDERKVIGEGQSKKAQNDPKMDATYIVSKFTDVMEIV